MKDVAVQNITQMFEKKPINFNNQDLCNLWLFAKDKSLLIKSLGRVISPLNVSFIQMDGQTNIINTKTICSKNIHHIYIEITTFDWLVTREKQYGTFQK